MSQLNIPMKLTQAGKAAAINAATASIQLQVTHFQFGAGQYNPTNNETALLDPKQAVPIAASSVVVGGAAGQFRAHAVFAGNTNYPIGEIGLWAGDPAVAGSVLVSVYSAAAPVSFVAYKTAGVNLTYTADIYFGNDVPPGSITIVVDSGQSQLLTMLAAHEAAIDPHPQYTTVAEATTIANTAAQAANPQLNLGTATLSGAAYTASAAPSAIPAGFSIRFLAAQPANPTLTVGTTTAPMVDSDGTPIVGIAANERRWVQWDGTSFVVAESDAGLSAAELVQVNGLIGAASDTARIDVPSAATIDLTALAPNTRNIRITGTASISAFTVAAGKNYFVTFGGAATLVNGASLVTQTGANIVAADGDTCLIRPTAANVVEVMMYVKAAASSGAQSLASNGYKVFDGGLIKQWGTISFASSTNPVASVAFPIAFPTAVVFAAAIRTDQNASIVERTALSTTGATFRLIDRDSGVTVSAGSINWEATGY